MIKGLFKKVKLIIEVSRLEEEKLYNVEIHEHSDKRTKSMNSYYWVLITKLAEVLRTSKDELHEQIIKRYSSRDFVSLKAEVNASAYFKYYDLKTTYKHLNNTFKSYLIYKRSSDMTKKEFRVLLDGLISECQECGIQTMTPEEIEKLKYIEESRR